MHVGIWLGNSQANF